MEAYAEVLMYAIPGFFLLIIGEALAARYLRRKINRDLDVISSLSSGVTNTIKNILGLSIIIVSYDWMVGQLGLWEWNTSVAMYILAFIGIDFAAYWSHRFNHEINILWNRHLVHHSSEEFNLSCALRQPISNVISIYFFLYIPLALIGIPSQVIAILAPLHLFAQFWYHTRLIDNMGWLEYIIVTPSHHRVHHAINDEYIDKNYAAIFILWDKWFGTFQEEKNEIPPVYGTKTAVKTWNPILINYFHFWHLLKDAWNTKYWKDKLLVWIQPTGWRPRDLRKENPSEESVYDRPKYEGVNLTLVRYYAWFQLIAHNLILIWVLLNIASFTFGGLLGVGVFLFLGVFAYTSLMDGHFSSGLTEALKLGLGIYFIFFAQAHVWPIAETSYGATLLTTYTLISAISTFAIYLWIIRQNTNESVSLKNQTLKKQKRVLHSGG
jgi:sterol desaturase/sphingolipid hydroxylase (fatty acid hydroxylase superfamily)